MDTIGSRIKQLRDSRRLSMADLEDSIGASRGSVNSWEKGKSIPGGERVISLSDFFGVSTDYILKGYEPLYQSAENNQRPVFLPEWEEFYHLLERESCKYLLQKVSSLPDEDIELLNIFSDRLLKSAENNNLYEHKKRPPFEDRGLTIREKNLPEHYYVRLPLVGQVPAGDPIAAIENVDEFIDVPADLVSSTGSYFVLKIKGNSMKEADIIDGNLVIVKQQPDAENGEIVVAMTNEEDVTVKTFYREDGYIRLQPQNKEMEPIISRDVKILGKVIAVYRQAK